MGKPTICIGENKDADQLRGNREADQRLCFRYTDSTIPPSSFLCFYSPVCVRPVRKPHCWFSHEVALFNMIVNKFGIKLINERETLWKVYGAKRTERVADLTNK